MDDQKTPSGATEESVESGADALDPHGGAGELVPDTGVEDFNSTFDFADWGDRPRPRYQTEQG